METLYDIGDGLTVIFWLIVIACILYNGGNNNKGGISG